MIERLEGGAEAPLVAPGLLEPTVLVEGATEHLASDAAAARRTADADRRRRPRRAARRQRRERVVTGRFVVLEGGDGSGKSTQLRRLAAWLRDEGLDVVETFEPGATAAGAAIRELLLHRTEPLDPVAEALLMAADRAEHVATVIRPALERGAWVVSDRFLPSSLVYQGVVRGLGVEEVAACNRLAVGEVVPDAVVLLDVSDTVAESRRTGDADRLEAEGGEFHARVRAAYRELATTQGWAIVAADGPLDQVGAAVRAAVAPLLAG